MEEDFRKELDGLISRTEKDLEQLQTRLENSIYKEIQIAHADAREARQEFAAGRKDIADGIRDIKHHRVQSGIVLGILGLFVVGGIVYLTVDKIVESALERTTLPKIAAEAETLLVSARINADEISKLHAGTKAYKLFTGSTPPGKTAWGQEGDFLSLSINTSGYGFRATPTYYFSIYGAASQWFLLGESGIYNASKDGFTIFVGRPDRKQLKPDDANAAGWHVRWIAVVPDSEAVSR